MFPSFESILSSLQLAITEIEGKRKKAKLIFFSSAVFFILLLLFISMKMQKPMVMLLFGSIVIMFLIAFVYFGVKKRFVRSYANLIVSQLVDGLFQNITPPVDETDYEYHATYTHNKHITMDEINKSKLYINTKGAYGEDYIEGQMGLTAFQFSEVVIRSWGSGSDDKESTVFRGVVFIADFNKPFSGSTHLLRRRFFNKTALYPSSIGAHKIELVDNDFNKAFLAYTTDDVESRYILSADFTRKILDYSNRLNGKVEFAFIDSKMYIFRETKQDHFSGKLFKNNDEDVLRQIYDDFIEYFNLVDELSLNRRIWSKG